MADGGGLTVKWFEDADRHTLCISNDCLRINIVNVFYCH